MSHLKNHLHSKHKNIAIELGILERRRVRNNNHNEDNGEENTVFVSRKKVKYDFDINDTVRDFIKSILMRNLPMTVANDMGKNEMIRKALQAFGVTWNRQKAKEFILKAADQTYEIVAKDIENVYPSLMFVFSVSSKYKCFFWKYSVYKRWKIVRSNFKNAHLALTVTWICFS